MKEIDIIKEKKYIYIPRILNFFHFDKDYHIKEDDKIEENNFHAYYQEKSKLKDGDLIVAVFNNLKEEKLKRLGVYEFNKNNIPDNLVGYCLLEKHEFDEYVNNESYMIIKPNEK